MKRAIQRMIRWGTVGSMVMVVWVGMAEAAAPPLGTTYALQRAMCNIIDWMIYFILTISIIMVVMAAFQYVTAGDNTEKTTKGRKTLTYAAVGIAVVLLAKGFPVIVSSVVGGQDVSGFTCTGGGPSGGGGTGGGGGGGGGLIST